MGDAPLSGSTTSMPCRRAKAVRRMRTGTFAPRTYAAALLERARRFASLNAFITLDAGQVMEDARRADRERAAGNAPRPSARASGPREGQRPHAPAADHAGHPARWSTRPRDDAPVVQRLLAQGAIVMGKTNLQELSRGWTSNNMASRGAEPARPGAGAGRAAAAARPRPWRPASPRSHWERTPGARSASPRRGAASRGCVPRMGATRTQA
jgi:mandelamide amidase